MKKQKIGDEAWGERLIPAEYEPYNDFENYLKTSGYKISTRQAYLISIKHCVYWLERSRFNEKEITPGVVHSFLADHMPACRCPFPVRRDIKTIRAALNQFLLMNGYARNRKTIDKIPKRIETTIDRFDEYLRNVCGHSENTRWYHRRHVRKFLLWFSDYYPTATTKISPEALCRFVTTKAGDYRPGSIGVLVYSLRTYLKFLQFSGHAIPSLAAAIPRPPNWSAANLSKALNPMELALFWSVFDRKTAIGKRDYAMARCLMDLGLRCYEVANMQLNAIDWHSGVLHLPRTKSRREEALPIPDTMGRALVAYLRYGRPKTNSQSVFVHHRAPIGASVQNTTVRGAIRRAFSRAVLPFSGTHVLRNTFASRLLEGGASLKEIADMLRHRSIDTTKSYVKIDFAKLALVAMPWPGRSI